MNGIRGRYRSLLVALLALGALSGASSAWAHNASVHRDMTERAWEIMTGLARDQLDAPSDPATLALAAAAKSAIRKLQGLPAGLPPPKQTQCADLDLIRRFGSSPNWGVSTADSGQLTLGAVPFPISLTYLTGTTAGSTPTGRRARSSTASTPRAVPSARIRRGWSSGSGPISPTTRRTTGTSSSAPRTSPGSASSRATSTGCSVRGPRRCGSPCAVRSSASAPSWGSEGPASSVSTRPSRRPRASRTTAWRPSTGGAGLRRSHVAGALHGHGTPHQRGAAARTAGAMEAQPGRVRRPAGPARRERRTDRGARPGGVRHDGAGRRPRDDRALRPESGPEALRDP